MLYLLFLELTHLESLLNKTYSPNDGDYGVTSTTAEDSSNLLTSQCDGQINESKLLAELESFNVKDYIFSVDCSISSDSGTNDVPSENSTYKCNTTSGSYIADKGMKHSLPELPKRHKKIKI